MKIIKHPQIQTTLKIYEEPARLYIRITCCIILTDHHMVNVIGTQAFDWILLSIIIDTAFMEIVLIISAKYHFAQGEKSQ